MENTKMDIITDDDSLSDYEIERGISEILKKDAEDLSAKDATYYHDKELYILVLITETKDQNQYHKYKEIHITDLDGCLLKALKDVKDDEITSFMVVSNSTHKFDWGAYISNIGIDKNPKDIQDIVEKKTGIRPRLFVNSVKYHIEMPDIYAPKIVDEALKKIESDNGFSVNKELHYKIRDAIIDFLDPDDHYPGALPVVPKNERLVRQKFKKNLKFD
jgi:hypothetical protein